MARYYRQGGPSTDYDPLSNFGAIDGVLPGTTVESSSSITYSPNRLLMGYDARNISALSVPGDDPSARPFLPSQEGETFLDAIESH